MASFIRLDKAAASFQRPVPRLPEQRKSNKGGRREREEKRKGIEGVDSSWKRGTNANMQFTEQKQGKGANRAVCVRVLVCV